MKLNVLKILKSPWMLMVGATVLAAGIAWLSYVYLQQREARLKQELLAKTQRARGPKTAVVVPRMDVRPGVVIEQGVFVSRDIDADLVYPDTVAAADFDSVRGQRLARPVLKGRPVRLSDLQAPEVRDVAGILPDGTRAVTIEIDNVNSIAQTLRPGHRVDVFLVAKIDPARGVEIPESQRQQVSIFMQNLKVIATGKEFQNVDPAQLQRTEKMVRPGDMRREGENFDSVTLLVTPAEAQRLLLGAKLGTYRVAMRGREDEGAVRMPPLTASELLASAGSPQERRVEYIVGGRQGVAANVVPTMVPVPGAKPAAAPAAPEQARATVDPRELKDAMAQSLHEIGTPQRHSGATADAVMK